MGRAGVDGGKPVMDELEGRRLKAAILQEEVSDDVWERLIPMPTVY
jgi:hypothetical protein